MRILVVDDETLARRRLQSLLAEFSECEIIGEAANGKEALFKSSELNPDIVLLDIRMPEMDGLETAQHLAKLPHPPAVIFTTAYGDHALAAFEARAVDYLLKPIRRERLKKALDNAHRLNRAQLHNLQVPEQQHNARSHLSVNVRGSIQLIPVSEIYYFQADQKYVKVRHCNGEVLIEDALKTLEDEYAEQFLRIHRNALAALAHIEGIKKTADGACFVSFRDIEDQLEISRRHLAAVKKTLKRGI